MFYKIIEEISKELNIKYTYLSKNWIIKLTNNEQVKYIAGNKFDLNNHALGIIMDDKYAFYDTLKNKNIPVCIHNLFYSPQIKQNYAEGCNTYKDIYKYFDKYKHDIVVKINNGSQGKDVYHIKTKEELKKTLDKLFITNTSISICPYYKIKSEYRVIILNNQIRLIYKKIRPIVIGNGVKTVKELLNEFNPYYFNFKLSEDKILNKNESYVYDWKFNLSKGSIASIDISESTKEKLSLLALRVATKTGIIFASIDIIETTENNFLVLEANSGVTMDKCINFIPNGYNIAKNIYKDAIKLMFNTK